ncbi:MAG: hypothetical protein HY973_03360 [Candidatus Kerfeldbacteria bacterium]|nr:hypothetical protein [Candidatus Kerfeldbacteria bacterium]
MPLFLVSLFFTVDLLVFLRNKLADEPIGHESAPWQSLLEIIGLPSVLDWFILVIIVACLYPVTRGWILEGLSSWAWVLSRLFDLLMYVFGGLFVIFYSFAWLSKRVKNFLIKTKETAEEAKKDKINYFAQIKTVFQGL